MNPTTMTGLTPSDRAMGATMSRLAAWEFTSLPMMNRTMAYIHTWWDRTPERLCSRLSRWAWTTVSVIQATPKMENMAVAPALNTAVEAILPACTLQVSRMRAPAASMTIWMTRFMLRRSRAPSSPVGNAEDEDQQPDPGDETEGDPALLRPNDEAGEDDDDLKDDAEGLKG